MGPSRLAQITLPGESGTQQLQPPSGISHLSGDISTTGKKFIGTGYQLFFIAAIILAVIFMITAGVRFITSGGDSEKISSAKKQMVYSIIGLIVVLTSFFIVSFVIKTSGGDTNFFLGR